MSSKLDDLKALYQARCHAMQSAVAFALTNGSTEATPKHLRVGVNSAMIETSTRAQLLMRKGIITEEEFYEGLLEGLEREIQSYKDKLPPHMRDKVEFG